MKKDNNIINRITAVFMLVLLLFPIITEATHAFNDHDHPVCTEASTHIHELEPDCSLCDFHFTAFNFIPLQKISAYKLSSYLQITSHYVQLTSINKAHHYLLRGPPQIQQFS